MRNLLAPFMAALVLALCVYAMLDYVGRQVMVGAGGILR